MTQATVTILSLDPGTSNHAYAVTELSLQEDEHGDLQLAVLLLVNGLVPRPLRSVAQKEFVPGMKRYLDFMDSLINQYTPDVIVAERFMNRGSLGGSSSELIGYMLGGLYLYKSIGLIRQYTLIGASTWKNALGRVGFDLKEVYPQLCDMSVKPAVRLTPHQIDAVLIGLFMGHQLLGIKPFTFVPQPEALKRMLEATQVRPPKIAKPRKPRKKAARGKKK